MLLPPPRWCPAAAAAGRAECLGVSAYSRHGCSGPEEACQGDLAGAQQAQRSAVVSSAILWSHCQALRCRTTFELVCNQNPAPDRL